MKYLGSIKLVSKANQDIIKLIKQREHELKPEFNLNDPKTSITIREFHIQSNMECELIINKKDSMVLPSGIKTINAPITDMIITTSGVTLAIDYAYGDSYEFVNCEDDHECNIEGGSVDLSNYYNKDQTDARITEEILAAQFEGTEVDLSSYATKTYVQSEISKIELLEGPQGPMGPQGIQGIKGGDGYTPIKGIDYFDGAVGPKGEQGIQGPRGLDGEQGPRGEQGERGLQGDRGEIGPQGLRGEVGPQGEPGPQGPKGDTGVVDTTNFYTKSQTDDRISAEIANAQLGGDGEVDLSGYATKIYVDDEISKIELLEGPQGPIGLTGPKGDVGAIGPQGIKGDAGPTGATGPKGDIGPQGPQGIQGLQGAPGIQGLKGDKGEPGVQGPKGDAGATGPQGLKGDKGDIGPKGENGYTPIKGIDYFDGEVGPQGPKGETGPPGPAGGELGEMILTSPNGGQFKIFVTNEGLLQTLKLSDGETPEEEDTTSNPEIFEEVVIDTKLFTETPGTTDFIRNGTKMQFNTVGINSGVSTETLTEQLARVKGKKIVVTADVLTENTTVIVKIYSGSWSFARIQSIDAKAAEILIPDSATDFKIAVESNLATSNSCAVENIGVYIKRDIEYVDVNSIPNRNYGIWSWRSEQVLNPQETLDFLKAHKIKKIYQQTNFSSGYTQEQLRTFVKLLKDNGVKVNLLDGNPVWCLEENRTILLQRIQAVIDYNKSATHINEKVEALQLDIEPHTLEGWSVNKEYYINQFQRTLVNIYPVCKQNGIKLIMCLAHWYDGNTYDNEFGKGNFYDFVAENCDETIIMAYSPKNYLSLSQYELAVGKATGHKVAVGFETKAPGSSGVTEDITYFGRPRGEIYSDFETVYLAHQKYGTESLHEFAIHDFTAFKNYMSDEVPGEEGTEVLATWEAGSLGSSGSLTSSSSSIRTNYIDIDTSKSYSLNFGARSSYVRVGYYDTNKTFISLETGYEDNSSTNQSAGTVWNLNPPGGTEFAIIKLQISGAASQEESIASASENIKIKMK